MSEHIKALTHVSYFCSTPALFREMISFYRDILGFQPKFTLQYSAQILEAYRAAGHRMTAVPGDVWIAYLEIAPGQFVEFFNCGSSNEGISSVQHVCYVVKSLKDAAAELIAKGVRVGKAPIRFGVAYDPNVEHEQGACGSYTCFMQDPAGNDIELMEYTKDSMQIGGPGKQ